MYVFIDIYLYEGDNYLFLFHAIITVCVYVCM
jgi:hypothetical protein